LACTTDQRRPPDAHLDLRWHRSCDEPGWPGRAAEWTGPRARHRRRSCGSPARLARATRFSISRYRHRSDWSPNDQPTEVWAPGFGPHSREYANAPENDCKPLLWPARVGSWAASPGHRAISAPATGPRQAITARASNRSRPRGRSRAGPAMPASGDRSQCRRARNPGHIGDERHAGHGLSR
jgi:hypothetical protein